MIIGIPDPKCICCRPDMPYHWHHDYMGVDVYPPRSPHYATAKVSIAESIGGLDLTPAEALEMARHYVLQVDRITTIDHKSIRTVIEICAGCYTKFPWNLDIEP